MGTENVEVLAVFWMLGILVELLFWILLSCPPEWFAWLSEILNVLKLSLFLLFCVTSDYHRPDGEIHGSKFCDCFQPCLHVCRDQKFQHFFETSIWMFSVNLCFLCWDHLEKAWIQSKNIQQQMLINKNMANWTKYLARKKALADVVSQYERDFFPSFSN